MSARFPLIRLLMAQGVNRTPLYRGLGAMVLASLLDGVGLGLLVPFFRVLLAEPDRPSVWRDLLPMDYDRGTLLMGLAAILLMILTIKGVAFYFAQVQTAQYREQLIESLRSRLFAHYLAAPVYFFDTQPLGELTSVLLDEVSKVRLFLANLFILFASGLTLLAYLGVLSVVSWPLTIAMVLVLTGIVVGLRVLLKRVKAAGKATSQTAQRLSIYLSDVLAGVRLVKTTGAESYELARLAALSQESLRVQQRVTQQRAFLEPATELTTLTLAMGVLVGAYTLLIAQGWLSTAGVFVFLLVLLRLLPLFRKINIARTSIEENRPALQRIFVALAPHAAPSQREQPFIGLGAEKTAAIHFENVHFAYPGQPEVLKGIDLVIAKGTTVAVVGSSGAGKSTLAALLLRFYDVTEGVIRMGNLDSRCFDPTSLRRHIGVVSQDTYLFNTTIWANLTYGLPELEESAVFAAAQAAYAHEFIQDLPQGYQTLVGERGIQLSGGQRQRLAIARTLLRNPEILILDEATSALDGESERLVQAALERLAQARTVLVIAHRLATVQRADQIVVLEQGKIVEQGTHSELLAQEGRYWSFHNLQTLRG